MKEIKEKVPSEFSLIVCLKHDYINSNKYINLSILRKKDCCGPTENRTRNFCVSGKHFTIKLLAHNSNHKIIKYLNFVGPL